MLLSVLYHYLSWLYYKKDYEAISCSCRGCSAYLAYKIGFSVHVVRFGKERFPHTEKLKRQEQEYASCDRSQPLLYEKFDVNDDAGVDNGMLIRPNESSAALWSHIFIWTTPLQPFLKSTFTKCRKAETGLTSTLCRQINGQLRFKPYRFSGQVCLVRHALSCPRQLSLM